ncbi:hypothetical protein IFM89_025253 [Coptis chinensis]|uniref:CCHC-type domain-containing protein n=1 Tax=Coptis chinensis TaxID=261450 RepID=A0A835I7U4_9MAGN|nr:hypothetical protein IFM89_025253 [Coptis chinensis]
MLDLVSSSDDEVEEIFEVEHVKNREPEVAYTVNDVVDDWEHVLGSLDPETFDEVTLGETFTYGDGDALDNREIRSDDEGDKMYEYDYSFGPVFETVTNNDEWSAEDEDEEDYNYNPSDSDYSVCGTDDEALDDIEPMVLEEEVQNLEEELQGSDLSNVVKVVNTNIFEAEEMDKLAGPKVENVFMCDLKPKMCWPTWKVSASVTKRDNHTFILSKLLDQHTCETYDENKYAQATSPWEAAITYKLPELTRILGTINKTDSAALDWLDSEPRECWARAHFDWTSKCDELTNNFSESFNSWILKIRDKPLVQFIDMYNLLLLKSIYDRRMLSMDSFEHGVVPNVLYMIKKREERSALCACNCSTQIKEGTIYGLDIVVLILMLRPSKQLTQTLDKELVLPPELTTQPGRPRKQRIRADDEMPQSKKKCAKCQKEGHNSRSCDARKKGEFGKKKKIKGAQTEQEVSQQQPPPQVQQQQEAPTQGRGRRGKGGKGRGGTLQKTTRMQEPQAEQPPCRGGRGRGAPVQEVAPVQEPQAPGRGGRGRGRGAPVQEPQAPGRGGRGRPRGGKTGR